MKSVRDPLFQSVEGLLTTGLIPYSFDNNLINLLVTYKNGQKWTAINRNGQNQTIFDIKVL